MPGIYDQGGHSMLTAWYPEGEKSGLAHTPTDGSSDNTQGYIAEATPGRYWEASANVPFTYSPNEQPRATQAYSYYVMAETPSGWTGAAPANALVSYFHRDHRRANQIIDPSYTVTEAPCGRGMMQPYAPLLQLEPVNHAECWSYQNSTTQDGAANYSDSFQIMYEYEGSAGQAEGAELYQEGEKNGTTLASEAAWVNNAVNGAAATNTSCEFDPQGLKPDYGVPLDQQAYIFKLCRDDGARFIKDIFEMLRDKFIDHDKQVSYSGVRRFIRHHVPQFIKPSYPRAPKRNALPGVCDHHFLTLDCQNFILEQYRKAYENGFKPCSIVTMAKILKEKFPSQKVVYIDVYIDVYRFVRKAVPPEQQPPQYKVLQSEHKEFILKVYKEAFDKAAKNKCEYVPYAINVVGNMLKKEFPDSTSLHANKSIQQFVHRCLPLEQRPRKNRFLTLAQKKFIADVCRQSSNSINAKEMIKIMQDVFEDFDFGERTIRRYLNYEKKWIS